jgi:hypothetical protein
MTADSRLRRTVAPGIGGEVGHAAPWLGAVVRSSSV